jgi:signal transduction histidine kinase
VSSSNRKTRLVGFAIVLLSIAIAAAGFFVVRRDVEAMRQAGQENILWSAVQVEIELMRFQNVLAEFKADEPDISPGRVNTRFDILWSRVSLFRQGPVGDRLSAYDQETAAIALLFAKMQEAEPLVTGLVAGDRATASRLQDMFYPFSVALRRLSQTVLHGEEHKNADLREDLSRSSSILSVLSGIALMASLLLIFVFSRDSDRFRKLADENHGLLEASRHANRAKSQFLAMMSHELRTPMNGVLGLLALVRQQGLSQHQTRLMEQADRSGRQMIGLLRDILDFSALQDDQLKLEQKPFEPRRLIKAVRDMFEPVALREGIVFEAHADDSCPERIIGDFARMRQALTHLATYILETAGAGNIALDLSYEAGCLKASISFDYNRAGGEWEPDLIMGNADRHNDSFASEALGPAVSRGLIERMGGTTKLDNPGDNRIAVLVSVPAEKLIVDVLRIRVVCQSAALDAICRAALRAENVRFLDAGSTEIPHVVMIEAGGDREPANLKSSRETYPQAMLVALGKPQDAEEFDDIVQVPIDIAAVRQAGFMRMAFAAPEKPGLRFAEE